MAACDDITNAQTFPCSPTTFVAWSSLAYILLPLNIGIYDLCQLYLFSGNIFSYHMPFRNAFQTGIYSYILCLLSVIHAMGSFSCHGCRASSYFCYIDTVALYCIYLMFCMFSWIRLFCQFKINQYFTTTPNTQNNNNNDAKLVYSILSAPKYHWISTFISIFIALSFGIVAILTFGSFTQFIISCVVYSLSYFSFFVSEYLIRKILQIQPVKDGGRGSSSPSRSLRLSSMDTSNQQLGTSSQQLSLATFEIKTENKKAIFSLIFIIIAGCGYIIEVLEVDRTCMNIGHGIYHIFTAVALTFWYWSLVGEKWSFVIQRGTQSEIINNDNNNNKENTNEIVSFSPNSAGSATSDASLRRQILNSGSYQDTTYSTGHDHSDVNDAVLNMEVATSADSLYKTKSGRKRSFID